jgi:hypothetical protein
MECDFDAAPQGQRHVERVLCFVIRGRGGYSDRCEKKRQCPPRRLHLRLLSPKQALQLRRKLADQIERAADPELHTDAAH